MKFLTFTAIFLTALTFIVAPSFADSLQGYTSAKQAVMIDYETGTVLLEKNPDQQMPTSSLSKIMTIYMVFDALRDHRISLDTELPVSKKAWKKQGSKMFVEVGHHVKVDDLIKGVLVQSGNDATIVLAEGLAGNEDAFAAAMTEKAHELGMSNSNFANASGWPDPDHYSTAHDLCTIAKHVIDEFPQYFHYFSIPEFSYNNIKQRNRNPLLYRNINADGMKTGYTVLGGYGLMGTGKQNGRRVILLINGLKHEKDRANEGARLLEWGLNSFKNVNLVAAGETVTDAKVVLGKSESVPLTVPDDLRITIPVNDSKEIKLTVTYMKPLIAPVEAGTQVGTLKIDIPGLKEIEVPLVTAKAVEKKGLISGTFEKAKIRFLGIPSYEK